MKHPTLSKLNEIRHSGFRPQVVGCYLYEKKILFVYKDKHRLWQFPQGGIDNCENLETAFFRETKEELGDSFAESCSGNVLLFQEDQIIFAAKNQNKRELKDEKGRDIFMKGKKYFFVANTVGSSFLDISQSEFDDFSWLTFEESLVLCETIYQKSKKGTMIKAVNKLHVHGLL
jgi:putative (di)nucleoside polyphosphate hydrolase